MRLKLTVLCILLSAIPLFAQNQTAARGDIWVTSVLESNLYSVSGPAFGGGAALGYGDRVSVGLRVVLFSNIGETQSLEFNFLLRFYLARLTGHSGFFIQLNGGPVIFAQSISDIAVPSEIGTVSAGLSLGWRFLLGKNFFLEPIVRGGYPYYAGAGINAGFRF